MYRIDDIAFEHISGDYYWGKYGEFKVVINTQTEYINATCICKQAERELKKSRKFSDWSRLSSSIALMREVSKDIRKPMNDLLVVVTNQRNEIKGTFVHCKLIPHIAYWASPKFAVAVMNIVEQFIIRRAVERSVAITSSTNLSVQLQTKVNMRDSLVNATLPYDRELQCLYFIKSCEFTKIGYTSNLPRRLQSLQVGNPISLKIIYSILTRYAKQIETDIHLIFANYNIGGEWFKLPDDAMDIVIGIYGT